MVRGVLFLANGLIFNAGGGLLKWWPVVSDICCCIIEIEVGCWNIGIVL
jgi:hypothetical protein